MDAVRRRDTGTRLLRITAAALLATLAVVTVSFFAEGGRFFVVRTPSMGTTAPVGTLVLTRPVELRDVRVGDLIAFHPPTEPGETYTHRVVAVTPAGLQTRGDANGAVDPWRVTSHDLVGRSAVVLPGVGWLLRALPILLTGGVLVWLVTAFVGPAHRGPARQFGGALVFLVAMTMLRPFVGVTQLNAAADPDGRSRITAVSTGLLPIRLAPAGGAHAEPVDLATGETGVSVLSGGKPGAQYHLEAELHLQWWQWLVAIVVVLSPLLWTVLVGFRPAPVTARAGVHRAVPA